MSFSVPRSDSSGGVGDFENSDAARNIHSLVRYGVVEQADYLKRVLRVRIGRKEDPGGSILTGWIPFMADRALNLGSATWDPPEVGENVTLLCPSGEINEAIVLNGARYGTLGIPPVAIPRGTVHRRQFVDGTFLEYDRLHSRLRAFFLITGTTLEYDQLNQKLFLDVKGDIEIKATGNIKITAEGDMELKANRIDLNP